MVVSPPAVLLSSLTCMFWDYLLPQVGPQTKFCFIKHYNVAKIIWIRNMLYPVRRSETKFPICLIGFFPFLCESLVCSLAILLIAFSHGFLDYLVLINGVHWKVQYHCVCVCACVCVCVQFPGIWDQITQCKERMLEIHGDSKDGRTKHRQCVLYTDDK